MANVVEYVKERVTYMGFIKDAFRTKIEDGNLIFMDTKTKTMQKITLPISQIVTLSKGIGGRYVTTRDGRRYKLLPISKEDLATLEKSIGQ